MLILGGEIVCHLEYFMPFLDWENGTFKYILFLYYAYTVQIKIQYKEKALYTGSQRAICNSHSSTCSHQLHNCFDHVRVCIVAVHGNCCIYSMAEFGLLFIICSSECNVILHNNRVAFIIHKVHVNIALH